MKTILRGSVAVFYLLIGLEIVIMVSPFATYFYAAYGPALNFLYAFPATAWLTGFFLPHAVVSESSVLNFLNGFGRTLFSLGLIVFLIEAVQIYSAKLLRRGVVKGGLYRWIRHPQYLFLAIAGLGLLLFWPRFLILVLYVAMLFVYYLLARFEEGRMETRHPGSYGAYKEKTAMFLPGEPGGKIFRALFGWIRPKSVGLAAAFVASLGGAVVAGLALRQITIANTTMMRWPKKQIAMVSVYPQSEASMKEVMSIVYADSRVDSLLREYEKEGNSGYLVHIMPRNYMMQGLFADAPMHRMSGGSRPRGSFRGVLRFVFPFTFRSSHRMMMGVSGQGPVRVIFSQLTWPDGSFAPSEEALAFTVKHLPLFRADVDVEQGRVLAVEKTPSRNYWGQMPMPAF